MTTNFFGRVANRVKRQVLAQVTPIKWAADGKHEQRRRDWAPYLPQLAAPEAAIVMELNRVAIRVSQLDDLNIPTTDQLKIALDRLVQPLSELPANGHSTLRLTSDQLLADRALWHWGLQEPLLNLVENYLGVPARYYGPDARREVGNNEVSGVRLWHRDAEDRRTIKILIWLNDVDEQGGPYAYVPMAETLRAIEKLHYVSGFVSDERLRSSIDPSAITRVTGPKWTTLMADNCRLLHRATPPVARDRYSVTFTWSSRTPMKIEEAPTAYAEDQLLRIRGGLSDRQLACLPPALTV